MAKKKSVQQAGSPIGYSAEVFIGNEKPSERDNNPAGPSQLPDHALSGYSYAQKTGTSKIKFFDDLGRSESSGGDDVNVLTANGISNSRNRGRGMQYNWGEGLDKSWNKNDDWDGGNLSGI